MIEKSYWWVILLVADLIIVVPQSIFDPEPHHDGIMLSAAIAVSEGKIPQRDVFSQYGPLPPIVQGMWIKIFGPHLISLRLMTALLLSLTAVLVYFIAIKYVSKSTSSVIQATFILTSPHLPLPPNLPWATIITTFMVLLAICIYEVKIPKCSPRLMKFYLLLIGFLLTEIALARIQSLLIVLVTTIYLGLKNYKTKNYEELLFFIIGSSITIISNLYWILKDDAFVALINQTVLWPKSFYFTPYLPWNMLNREGLVYYSSWLTYPFYYFVLRYLLKSKSTAKWFDIRIISTFFSLILCANLLNPKKSWVDPIFQLQYNAIRSILAYSYFFALLIFIGTLKRLAKDYNSVSLSTIIAFATLPQLFPGNDAHHLYWVTPVLIVGALPLLVVKESGEKTRLRVLQRRLIIILAGCVLSSAILTVNYFSIPRAKYNSPLLSWMIGNPKDVKSQDEFIKEITNVKNKNLLFDCADALYSVSNGKYLPKNHENVNWGLGYQDFNRPGNIVVGCRKTETDLDIISKLSKVHFLYKSKDSNGNFNVIYQLR